MSPKSKVDISPDREMEITAIELGLLEFNLVVPPKGSNEIRSSVDRPIVDRRSGLKSKF